MRLVVALDVHQTRASLMAGDPVRARELAAAAMAAALPFVMEVEREYAATTGLRGLSLVRAEVSVDPGPIYQATEKLYSRTREHLDLVEGASADSLPTPLAFGPTA